MDATDKKIISILQRNGRVSIQQLADSIFLSGPAAAERVKKLEDQGIIKGYTALIDPVKCHLPIHVFMFVSIAAENRRRFYDFITKNLREDIEPGRTVIKCHYSRTGNVDVIMEIFAPNMDEIFRIQNDLYGYCMTTTSIVGDRPAMDDI